MPRTLTCYSTNGQPNRDIMVPGRSALRPYGAIRIASNSGQRLESDWAAIKAAIGAGSVVIALSAYETDTLPEHLPGNFAYGGNVRFDCPREPKWRLQVEGGMCSFAVQAHPCKTDGCTDGFDDALALGRHVRSAHRSAAGVT